jgi:tetratricopeptide (TPR) repeat protein
LSAVEGNAMRETVHRILASPGFEKSGRARELLTYLVNEEIAGRGEQIKGYTIAVDVFGKGTKFDASTDPLVRVHVGRLRDLLDTYYRNEGASDAFRLRIPKGGYRPEYSAFNAEGKQTGISTPDVFGLGDGGDDFLSDLRKALPPSLVKTASGDKDHGSATDSGQAVVNIVVRHVRLYWLAFALIIGMLSYLLYSQFLDSEAKGSQIASAETASLAEPRRGFRGAPGNDLLPSIEIVVEQETPVVKAVFTELRNAVPRFDNVRLVRIGAQSQGAEQSTHYFLRLFPGANAGQAVVNLDSRMTGATLQSDTFSPADPKFPLAKQLAGFLTKALGEAGVIYGDIGAADSQNAMTSCILLNQAYFLDPSDLGHRKAYDCFNKLALRGTRSALVYAELSALVFEAVTDKRDYPADASTERAQKLAEKALSLGPDSASAHRAMSFAFSKTGDGNQSIKSAEKAYQRNPYNLDLVASYGYALTMTQGDFRKGGDLLREAVDGVSTPQPWWVYGLVAAYYAKGNHELAYSYTDRIRTRTAAHYVGLRLAAAMRSGHLDEAEILAGELKSGQSRFAADPEGFFKRAKYPLALTAKLLEDLAAFDIPASQ